ncbi:MAG TPA: ferritin-like domain-containing protein [Solirubrobacterales bacterium]|nr:ferritin-like domain-containing protein [Solirubrobacterales bacterium]
MTAATRRAALRRWMLAAGALATPVLLRPPVASAQDDEDPAVLEEFLVEAIVLEQITVLAYATAGGELEDDRRLARTLERFERQEQIHAKALRSALDSIGVELPDAPASPDDVQAIEDAGAIDDERAEELTGLLGELDGLTGRDELLEHLIRLEEEQLRYFLDQAPTLEAEDILRTGVEIAACQAQHIVVLREALGASPAEAVPEVPATAASS